MKEIKKLIKKLITKVDLCYNQFKQTKGNQNMENNNQEEINIFDIANYIIEKAKQKQIDDMTNLKLNKLIYYCYAKYLVETKGQKLIPNIIQAWRYGPVFPDLYKELKPKGNKIVSEIPNSKKELNLEQKKIIDYVIAKYVHYEPWDLTAKTHEEDPWYDTFPAEKLFSRRIISDEKILKFYSKNPV